MTVKTEKIDMNSRIGDRFEPVSITPRRMVEVLDCDDEKIKGLSIGQATYKLSDRFYKTLAAELGIPFGVFGFFTPLEVMTRAAEKEPDLALRVTVDTERNQALGLTQDKGLPMPVKFIEGVLHEDRRLQEVEYGNGMLSAMLDLDDIRQRHAERDARPRRPVGRAERQHLPRARTLSRARRRRGHA